MKVYVPVDTLVKHTFATPEVVDPKVAPVGFEPEAVQIPVLGVVPVKFKHEPPQAVKLLPALGVVHAKKPASKVLLNSFQVKITCCVFNKASISLSSLSSLPTFCKVGPKITPGEVNSTW